MSPDSADVLDAAALMSQRGMFGVIWVDTELRVAKRYGALADFIEVGEPLAHSLLPLHGMEAQIGALRQQPDAALEISNVSIHYQDGMTPKMNISVFWIVARTMYIVLLGRIISRTDAEIELAQQIRLRMIAEALVVEKSLEVERANLELTRANRDLAEFAYVISHDLKAPLRGMRYIADDLQASLDRPREDQQAHIELLRQQSKRMSAMLTGLLEYSRAGRKEDVVETVDTSGLVHSIVGSLRSAAGLSVQLRGDWPVVKTLVAPLDLVLRNLIDNALKHHDRTEGIVMVSCQVVADALEIEISDDGPGIESRYHNAVFQPFVKLKPDANIESSGVGLAIVRKTVELAGGTLRLKSDPAHSRGTVFQLVWPLQRVGASEPVRTIDEQPSIA